MCISHKIDSLNTDSGRGDRPLRPPLKTPLDISVYSRYYTTTLKLTSGYNNVNLLLYKIRTSYRKYF
jgi:hypothetical protein